MKKEAGAELGQAQLKLGLTFIFYYTYGSCRYVAYNRANSRPTITEKSVYIGASVRRSSRSAFGRSTGNDVSGHYKRHYFLFLFFFILFFSSPLSPFLIERVLGSKNLFSEN